MAMKNVAIGKVMRFAASNRHQVDGQSGIALQHEILNLPLPSRIFRTNAILPMVSSCKIPTRISHNWHSELLHGFNYILPEAVFI